MLVPWSISHCYNSTRAGIMTHLTLLQQYPCWYHDPSPIATTVSMLVSWPSHIATTVPMLVSWPISHCYNSTCAGIMTHLTLLQQYPCWYHGPSPIATTVPMLVSWPISHCYNSTHAGVTSSSEVLSRGQCVITLWPSGQHVRLPTRKSRVRIPTLGCLSFKFQKGLNLP